MSKNPYDKLYNDLLLIQGQVGELFREKLVERVNDCYYEFAQDLVATGQMKELGKEIEDLALLLSHAQGATLAVDELKFAANKELKLKSPRSK